MAHGRSSEPITSAPPRHVPVPIMRQRWADVVFIHWETEAEDARAWLPLGTELDVHAGRAYVGLVALRICKARLGPLPVPLLRSFPEINVRVYSVDRRGRRGVVFCSLDAGRLLPALAGRAYGLPYMWANAAATRHGQEVSYRAKRRWPGNLLPDMRFAVRIGDPIVRPSALENFLTARWALHWPRVGRTWWSSVEHQPWELYGAELTSFDDELVQAAGLPTSLTGPASVLWSPGMPARIGPPRLVEAVR